MMISNGADSSYIDRKTQKIYKAQKAKGWENTSSQREGSIQKNLNMKQRHQSQGNRERSNPRAGQHGGQAEAENAAIDFGELTVPQANEPMDLNNNLKSSQI